MTKNLFLGTLLSFGLAACGDTTPPGGATSTASLSAVGTSGESGTAILTDKGNNMTLVSATASGGTDTGVQSAHIHVGACGSNGAVLVALNNVQGGVSSTTVNFALSMLTGGKYYINVHNSINAGTIQACGLIP